MEPIISGLLLSLHTRRRRTHNPAARTGSDVAIPVSSYYYAGSLWQNPLPHGRGSLTR
jgi:hypothetical protein